MTAGTSPARRDLREAERVYSLALEHLPLLRAARVDRAYVRRALGARAEAIGDLLSGAEDDPAALVAARDPAGKLRVRNEDAAGKAVEATLEGAGAPLALGDLDLDGVPEIVTTSDGADDVLLISSFGASGLAPRLRLSAKEGVRALGTCPPEDRGVPAVVAAVGSEVWLVR